MNSTKSTELENRVEPVNLKRLINDIVSAQSGAFDFEFKGGPPPELLVDVNPAKLTDEDNLVIKSLFTYFLQDQPTFELKLRLGKPNVPKLFYVNPYEVDRSNFNKGSVSLDHINMKLFFFRYHLCVDSKLCIGLLSALQENGFPIEVEKWWKSLKDEMLNFTLETDDKEKLVFDNFVQTFKYLYNLSKDQAVDQTVINDTFRMLLTMLISSHSLDSFPEIKNEPFLTALKELEGTNHFLHFAMQSNYPEGFELLLKLMGGKPLHDYDNNGNSFLHLCKDEKYFVQALKFSPDINHCNSDGNTALHEAADSGNLKKAQLLLKQGANPDIKNQKGETFWMLDPKQKQDSLHLYRLYKQYGHVLKIPPEIVKQEGLNCGFYAVACAASYTRIWQPELFKQPAIPARKRDVTPKSDTSLRQIRKSIGIPGQGAVFSTKELAKVIEKAGCKSLICEIDDYNQFMEVIKKAIEQNLPVIIPFASQSGSGQEGNPEHESPKGETAHWATIIGVAGNAETEGILLAQYGKYFDTKASELFKSFYDIEATFPERYLSKKKGGDWNVSNTPIPPTESAKTDVIPLTDLSDFRRKLIVVLPPNYDTELLFKSDREKKHSKNE